MRELCHSVTDIDRQIEDAARAKQQLDAERWREQVRPRAMRLFAARTAKLHDSRALLKLLVEGHSYKTAAANLNVSAKTISFHLQKIYEKLQVHSKSEAVAKALRNRLV